MTWKEWAFYSEGLRKNKLKEWEHTRALSWMLYKVNADPKKAAKDISKWWPLPTDIQKNIKKVAKGKRITEKQYRDFLERMR
jgi:hypothetical protein